MLPKYKSHKVVEAARVASILRNAGEFIVETPDGYERITVDPLKFAYWDQVRVGWYLIRYGDGFISVSPPEAFEEGYTRHWEPNMTREQADAMLKDKPAPLVTPEQMQGRIKEVRYLTDGVLTVCIIELDSGWTAVGKSAPASPANFDAEQGKRYAYDDAFRQLWPLFGFALKEKLHSESVA